MESNYTQPEGKISSRSRNITIIVLFILLTILSAIGIFVAINLPQNQAPDDSLADACGGVFPDANPSMPGCQIACGGCLLGRTDITWDGTKTCTQIINEQCAQPNCGGDGVQPAPGVACCAGLNLCPNGRCGVTCGGTIGGSTGSCPSGQWNLYECKGTCNPAGGCQTLYTGAGGSGIIEDQSGSRAYDFVNAAGPYTATTTCYVRQADCIGTSGVNLVFRSGLSCSNQCTTTSPTGPGGTPTGPGGTTGTTQLFCGDALCGQNELCERVSPGSNSFRACRAGDVGSSPTGQVVNNCYRIDASQTEAGTGPRCKFCGDGLFHPQEEQCDPTAPAGNGNDPTQCRDNCILRRRECLGATSSTTTLAPGAGNRVIFTFRFRDERSTNPYTPGTLARISTDGTDATAVGRDSNNNASTLVGLIPGNSGISRTQDTDGSYIYEYKFEWEAANTNGSPVAAGTYRVQFLNPNNSNAVLFPGTSCEASITVSSTQVENPLFSIVKIGTPVCESDNDSRIDYIVRVTNRGPVDGTIDFVRDTLDPQIISAGIVPTNINPAFGTYASGQITWIGTEADRTYAPNQTKEFTYSITIPANLVNNFAVSGVDNQVVVQYDTEDTDDNTDSFTLNTPVACTITVIPNTSLFDDGRFLLLGAMFVLTGLYVYRRQYIVEHSFETEIEKKLSRKADEQG